MIPENPLRREVCAFKLQTQESLSFDAFSKTWPKGRSPKGCPAGVREKKRQSAALRRCASLEKNENLKWRVDSAHEAFERSDLDSSARIFVEFSLQTVLDSLTEFLGEIKPAPLSAETRHRTLHV